MYWRQRLASETAAERERRLSQRRARDRARRAARSSPTSETRLVQMGSVERLYLQHAPAAERERRLSQHRARDRAQRAARSSPTSETRLVQMGSVERLYLQHGENYLNLSAFDDVLRDISCSSDVTPSTLLKAKPFTLSYVNNIIVSVEMYVIKLYIRVYNMYYISEGSVSISTLYGQFSHSNS